LPGSLLFLVLTVAGLRRTTLTYAASQDSSTSYGNLFPVLKHQYTPIEKRNHNLLSLLFPASETSFARLQTEDDSHDPTLADALGFVQHATGEYPVFSLLRHLLGVTGVTGVHLFCLECNTAKV
jgi:hypothetical protein